MKALLALGLLIGMNTAVFAGEACCAKKDKAEKKEAKMEKKADCTKCEKDADCKKCADKKAEKAEKKD